MSNGDNIPDSKTRFLVSLLIFAVWIISGMFAWVWPWFVFIGGAFILLPVAYYFGKWAGEEGKDNGKEN